MRTKFLDFNLNFLFFWNFNWNVIHTCSVPMATLSVRTAKREYTTIAPLVVKSWGTSDAWLLRKLLSHWNCHADIRASAAPRFIHIIANRNTSSFAGSDPTIALMQVPNARSRVTFQCSLPTWKMIIRWICMMGAHSIIDMWNQILTKWKMQLGCSL